MTALVKIGMGLTQEYPGGGAPLLVPANWSPTDKTAVTLTNANLTATMAFNGGVRAITGQTIGKYYFELTMTTWSFTAIGLALSSHSLTNPGGSGIIYVDNTGVITLNGTGTGSALGTRASGNIIGIAIDCVADLTWFCVAPTGNWNGSGTANLATGIGGINIAAIVGALFPIAIGGSSSAGDIVTANFGASAFARTPPSGYSPGWPSTGTMTTGAPPVLLTAQVTSTSGNPTKITMTFDSPLDASSVPASAAFLVVRNFVGKVPIAVTVSGSTCSVTLDADYGDPSGGTISYTPGTLKGANGAAVAAFSNVPVTP